MGQVVTFYSYKGGVGRTMTLANVAVILARWGHQVLIVDWDLEAPGIEIYFKKYLDLEVVTQQKGIIDLLQKKTSHPANKQQNWRDFIIDIQVPDTKGCLHLLTAGKRDDTYFGKVRDLDLQALYSDQGGLFLVESLRNEWKEEYDYILIDSRTGITDTGGICTIQLPDILVLLFTATEQSLSGIIKVAEKVHVAQQNLPFDRLKIVSVPIPSRFDTQTEFEISQEWLNRFSSDLADIYADWLPKSSTQQDMRRDILQVMKIPYVPYFSFGEKLPVIEHGTIDSAGLGYAYETLAALLGNNLELVEQLIEDRDGFVKAAMKKAATKAAPIKPSIFLSYSHEDEMWMNRLRSHLGVLEKADRITIWDDRQIDPAGKWYDKIKEATDRATVIVCLISADYLTSDFVIKEEIPYLLERCKEERTVIVPVLLRPCLWQAVPWLQNTQMLPHDGKSISKDFKNNWDEAFAEVAEYIFKFVEKPELDLHQKPYNDNSKDNRNTPPADNLQ